MNSVTPSQPSPVDPFTKIMNTFGGQDQYMQLHQVELGDSTIMKVFGSLDLANVLHGMRDRVMRGCDNEGTRFFIARIANPNDNAAYFFWTYLLKTNGKSFTGSLVINGSSRRCTFVACSEQKSKDVNKWVKKIGQIAAQSLAPAE